MIKDLFPYELIYDKNEYRYLWVTKQKEKEAN
jgi:hypothetical protein